MPDMGRPGDYLPSLGAWVQNAITVVADNGNAVLALQGLALTILRRPIADINDIYAEVARFDRTEQRYIEIATLEGEQWEGEIGRHLQLAFLSPPTLLPSLASTTALALALATGIELWRQELRQRGQANTRAQGELLLAFTIAPPEDTDREAIRLTFTEPRAVLVVRPGSLEVLFVVDKVVRAGRWAVSLLLGSAGRVRSAEAAARAFVENVRRAREGTNVLPLSRLDDLDHSVLAPPLQGVLIFLHGLMSTDLGTFDGFLRRWWNPPPSELPPALLQQHPLLLLKKELSAPAQQAIKHAVALVGWPHDTLTSIDQNAHDLARLIDERLSELSCKIIFVCHSRGGLVARAAAEKLYAKDKSWETRIAHCITFGTPHAGVALAEHPDRRLGFYVLAGLTRRQLAGLIDISAYLEQRDHIEGIENLQPPSARGTPFLRQLEDVEWRAAPRGRKRRLDVYAIGGVAQLGDKGGPLLERLGRLYDAYQTYYTGEIQSDLVVPLSSATAANNNYQPTQTSCDHFSYFNDGVCAEQAIWSAIRVLWEGFGLTHSMAKLLA